MLKYGIDVSKLDVLVSGYVSPLGERMYHFYHDLMAKAWSVLRPLTEKKSKKNALTEAWGPCKDKWLPSSIFILPDICLKLWEICSMHKDAYTCSECGRIKLWQTFANLRSENINHAMEGAKAECQYCKHDAGGPGYVGTKWHGN